MNCLTSGHLTKCFEIGCRYHIVADSIRPWWSNDLIAAEILRAKYTCLWEILEIFEKDVGFREIGAILGVSARSAERISERALAKLNNRLEESEVVHEEGYDDYNLDVLPRLSPSRWSLMQEVQ